MKKEIDKYPYSSTTEDETKIFLSDQVCEQVVSVTYRNGQIFCTIKEKITCKKKEITLSAAFIFGALFGMPLVAKSIGVTPIISSASEIHRAAPQHFHQHAPTINPRLDKIRLMPTKEMMPLIYLNAQHVYINEKILKRLRAGGLVFKFSCNCYWWICLSNTIKCRC